MRRLALPAPHLRVFAAAAATARSPHGPLRAHGHASRPASPSAPGSPPRRRHVDCPRPAAEGRPLPSERLTNLPAPRTRLIGRDQEHAAVSARVVEADGRLLTLTGAGGCGKTSLALEVARGLLDVFPDGVWLVELAALSGEALVLEAVAAALGVRESPERPLLDGLTAYLQPRAVLLVLDNCEHLIDACARLAEQLLDTCPDLRLLATSREPLRIPGEVTWRVPSLLTPDPRQMPPLE